MRIPVLFTVQMLLAVVSMASLARWIAPRRFASVRARRVLALGLALFWAVTVFVESLARGYGLAGGGPYRLPVAAQRTLAFVLLGAGLLALVARALMALAALASSLRARVGSGSAATQPAQPASEEQPAAAPPATAPSVLTRREAAQRAVALGAVATSTAALGYGARWLRREVRVREHEVYIPGLPAALEGLTLAQLTDIHVGVFTGPRDYEPVIEHVRRLRPDLVALTGDLLDHQRALVPEAMALFARTRGRRGTYAVLGNHDHYTSADDVLAGLRAAGITALDNESVFLAGGGASRDSGLVLAGLDDLSAPRYSRGRRGPDLAAALRGVPVDAPRVVLSHNPVTYAMTAAHCALQLSGHTHGGQINAGGIAGVALRYVSGFYAAPGPRPASLLFVSNGLGFTGPPVRLAAPAEVVLLGLTGRAGRGVRPGALPARG